jgi:plastocyanin
MINRFGTLAALCAITMTVASCGSDSDSESASTTAATLQATTVQSTTVETTPAETASAVASGGVEIKEFTFGPGEIRVAVGDSVTWTNNDNQKHTATASGAFDTGAIEAGSTGTATFDSAGTFAYICAFHPFMKGTVVVGP